LSTSALSAGGATRRNVAAEVARPRGCDTLPRPVPTRIPATGTAKNRPHTRDLQPTEQREHRSQQVQADRMARDAWTQDVALHLLDGEEEQDHPKYRREEQQRPKADG
jgi:hypothetical protein